MNFSPFCRDHFFARLIVRVPIWAPIIGIILCSVILILLLAQIHRRPTENSAHKILALLGIVFTVVLVTFIWVGQGHLGKTTLLDLSSSSASNATLRNVARMSQLRHLYLWDATEITDDGLAHLNNLKKLQSLNLCATRITDTGVVWLSPLINLEELVLSETKVTGSGLRHLKNFTNLKKLSLNHTRISDSDLEQLRAFQNLESLSLNNTSITDAGIQQLTVLPGIKYLSIDFTRVTDASASILSRFSRLETLSLEGTRVTEEFLIPLISMDIKTLNIRDTDILDLSGLREMKLEALICSDAQLKILPSIIHNIPTLRRINHRDIDTFKHANGW